MTPVGAVVDAIRMLGPHITIIGDEGPRKKGHCAYCAGPCEGKTMSCELRVYFETWELKR